MKEPLQMMESDMVKPFLPVWPVAKPNGGEALGNLVQELVATGELPYDFVTRLPGADRGLSDRLVDVGAPVVFYLVHFGGEAAVLSTDHLIGE